MWRGVVPAGRRIASVFVCDAPPKPPQSPDDEEALRVLRTRAIALIRRLDARLKTARERQREGHEV